MHPSKEAMMEGVVLMPVPFEHIGDVRALLERLESEGEAGGKVTERSRSELLRRIFEDCAEGTQQLLLELANNPGEWIYGHELAKVANPKGKSINTSPYMKSLNVADRRYRQVDEERIIKFKRGRNRLWQFMMEPEDAEVVQRFGG
jgi:hypothetical protein